MIHVTLQDKKLILDEYNWDLEALINEIIDLRQKIADLEDDVECLEKDKEDLQDKLNTSQ